MSDKTKYSRWLPWGIVITAVIGIGMLGGMLHWGWLTTPWSLAELVNRDISIAFFQSLNPDIGTFWAERWQALAGLIIFFVLGPSLWIWSEIQNQEEEDHLRKGLVWYMAATVVVLGLVTGVVGSMVEAIIFQNTQERASISENQDNLRSTLSMMAFDSIEQYYLPRNSGGGSGSFRSIKAGDTLRSIRLSDLESYDNTETENDFVLKEVESDSMITIYGIGPESVGNSSFENANGDTGKVQLSIKVMPKKEQMISLTTDNAR